MRLAGLLPRLLPSAVAAGLYLVFIVLWQTDHAAYEVLQRSADAISNPAPYSDLGSILQAIACAQQGVNVYVANQCMHGGLYNYSPFLLHVWPDTGTMLRIPLGLFYSVLFLLSAALLPPARGGRALLLRSIALCSGVVVWALEAANMDTPLFAFCVAGLCLVLAGRMAGFIGYALFALGGAIKFYPAVLLALSLREERRRFAVIAAVLALCGAVFLWRYGNGVLTALAILPPGLPFRGVFGAVNWPFGLALLRFLPVLTLEPNAAQYFVAMRQPHVEMYIIITARVLVVAGLYTAYRLAPGYAALLRTMPGAEKLFLAASCLIIAFCFFTTQNLDYRAIFLFLALPGLQYMAMNRPGRWLLAAVLLLMWEGMMRHAVTVFSAFLLGPFAVYPQIAFWLLREAVWWFVAVRLAAIAIAYLRAELRSLLSSADQLCRPGVSG